MLVAYNGVSFLVSKKGGQTFSINIFYHRGVLNPVQPRSQGVSQENDIKTWEQGWIEFSHPGSRWPSQSKATDTHCTPSFSGSVQLTLHIHVTASEVPNTSLSLISTRTNMDHH